MFIESAAVEKYRASYACRCEPYAGAMHALLQLSQSTHTTRMQLHRMKMPLTHLRCAPGFLMVSGTSDGPLASSAFLAKTGAAAFFSFASRRLIERVSGQFHFLMIPFASETALSSLQLKNCWDCSLFFSSSIRLIECACA